MSEALDLIMFLFALCTFLSNQGNDNADSLYVIPKILTTLSDKHL